MERLARSCLALGMPTPAFPDLHGLPDGLVRVDFGETITITPRAITPPAPLRVAVAPQIRSLAPRHKTDAPREEPPAGFDDVCHLNERGGVAELRFRNVLCKQGDTLYAPGPAAGALLGTTRARILEAWSGPFKEHLPPDTAGEWVATSVSGVCPIIELQGPKKTGPFLAWCQKVLDD